jgi:hypothetical protein
MITLRSLADRLNQTDDAICIVNYRQMQSNAKNFYDSPSMPMSNTLSDRSRSASLTMTDPARAVER